LGIGSSSVLLEVEMSWETFQWLLLAVSLSLLYVQSLCPKLFWALAIIGLAFLAVMGIKLVYTQH
jgi:hypothetical protein